MTDAIVDDEGLEGVIAKVMSVSERLDHIVTLVEEKSNEDEIQDLLRNPQGLLHEACSRASVTSVKILLEWGVATSEWDRSFLLPLHIVARRNLLEIASVLLKHNPEGVDRPSKFGETPLHFACMKGHTAMAKLLVKYKANVERRDHCENTTLHYAVASDNPELVEWLLRDKNMHGIINAKNRFHDTPLHRAAVLQSVNVIPILINYKVKQTNRDKYGFTAANIAALLYKNEMCIKLPNGEEERGPIFPDANRKQLPSLPQRTGGYRSASFSVPLSAAAFKQDGSTCSLPTSGGAYLKKPSATQARRPVNLTFSSDYSRQTSGVSSGSGSSSVSGSRASVYLKDKEQASRLSAVLDNNRAVEDVHKIVKDQTSYDPPIDLYFVGDSKPHDLTSSNPKLESKDHDLRVKINEKYWIHNPSEVVQCRLTASLHWNHAYPSGYVFVSPICFLSLKAKHPVPVIVSLPHAVCINNEAQLKRMSIFTSPTINPNSGLRISYPTHREFRRIPSSDLQLENDHVSFTITLNDPALFAVGFAVSSTSVNGNVSPTMFPIVPLRCCLYVACPSNQDQYLTNTDIWVYIGMSLRTVETAMKKHVVPHNFSLEEKRFILKGSLVSVDGELENSPSDWQTSKRGKGLFRYTQVALGQDSSQEIMSHHETYPSKEAFFIECHNPKKALKFRVTVVCDKSELVNMLVTPYIPPKVPTSFGGMAQIKERSDSPLDTSSTESIPMRTSCV